jgi:hypothetical protein
VGANEIKRECRRWRKLKNKNITLPPVIATSKPMINKFVQPNNIGSKTILAYLTL